MNAPHLHRLLSVFLLVAGWGEVAAGQPGPPDPGEDSGVSAERAAQVGEIFADLDGTHSPGCAVGVVRQQRLVYQRGFGMASLEQRTAIDENTVFYTGSVSKQFAAAAVAMAVREGHLSLDDSVRKWFPELPAYADVIEVRHLVHHTSGLRDYLGLMALAGVPFENVSSVEWVLELIARQEATNFPPGSEYLYSNSGYFLMAQLVARATGRSLRAYSQEKIFAPLGMRHTHFHDDRHEVVPNRAAAYSRAPDGPGFVVNWSPSFAQVGSGGLLSTIEDLARWDRSFYSGELGPGFWDSLQQRGVLGTGTQIDYAFGLTVDDYRGRRRIQHGGAMFGYRAQLTRLPDDQLSAIVLCNLAEANPGRRADQVLDVFLATEAAGPLEEGEQTPPDAVSAKTITLTMAERSAWLGEYELFPGVALAIVADGAERGGLVAVDPQGGRFSLAARSATELVLQQPVPPLTSAVLRLVEGDGGVAVELEVFGESRRSPRLAAREQGPAALDRWAGAFFSRELGATARLVRRGERLTYQIGSAEEQELILRTDGSASLPGMSLVGEDGMDGAVGAFVVDAGRVRGLRFERQ